MHKPALVCLIIVFASCVNGAVTPAPNFKLAQLEGFWWIDGSINLAGHFHNTSLATLACPTITGQLKDKNSTITLTFNYTLTATGSKVNAAHHFKPSKNSDAILSARDMDLVVTYFDPNLQIAILVEAKEKFVMTLSRNPFFDNYNSAIRSWLMHNVTPPINADDILIIDNRICVSRVPMLSVFTPKSIVGTWYINIHYASKSDLKPCQYFDFTSSKSYSSFYQLNYHVNNSILGGDEFLPLGGHESFWVPAKSKSSLVFSYKLPSDDVYLTFTNDGDEGFVISKKQTLDQKQSGLALSWAVENGFTLRNMNVINNLKCTKAETLEFI